MHEALELARQGVEQGLGGPFGAVVVRDGRVIARGQNRVTSSHDPTAHAEVVALREACRALERVHLEDCQVYTSCEPCPMCLSALYWAHVERIVFCADRHDAARAGFDDELLYREIDAPLDARRIPLVRCLPERGDEPFASWRAKTDRVEY